MRYLSAVLPTLLLLGCSGAKTPTAPADSAVTPEAAAKTDIAEAKAAQSADSGTAAENADDAKVDEPAKEAIEGAEQQNVRLVVKDQATAGQIVVEEVSTSRDGWVSVHKSQADGSIRTPEDIGKARVDSGDSENIVVDMWEAPAVGDKLWVLLHVDAGDRGLYEFPEKDVPVYKNGEIMARPFKIKPSGQAEE